MCLRGHICAMVYMCAHFCWGRGIKGQLSITGSVFIPGDRTQINRLDIRLLYLLSHLDNPKGSLKGSLLKGPILILWCYIRKHSLIHYYVWDLLQRTQKQIVYRYRQDKNGLSMKFAKKLVKDTRGPRHSLNLF